MLDLLPDLYDIYPKALTLAQPLFSDFGQKKIFYGEIVTVACFNDNSKVKALIDTDSTDNPLSYNFYSFCSEKHRC